MAFAQDATTDISLITFIQQTISDALSLKTITGGGPIVLGVLAVVLRFLISAVKVSGLSPLIWDKLGTAAKALYAPVLGLLLALVTLPVADWKGPTLLVAVMTGALAVPIHSVLKAIQGLPGISSGTNAVINIFETLLGGGQ